MFERRDVVRPRPQAGLGEVVDFLERELPGRIPRYFSELTSGHTFAWLHGGEPLVRKHSVLFEVEILDAARSRRRGLFVKIPKSGPNAARTIYRTLMHMHELAAGFPDEVNVVRPLDFFPQIGALATERIEGEELLDRLRKRRDPAGDAEILSNCGRFLRCYHQASNGALSPRDCAETFARQCDLHLSGLERNGVDGKTRARVRAGFAAAAEKLSEDVPSCVTPKDFTVRNILVQGARIYLIEATEARPKPVYEDLAAFLNSLTMLFWGMPKFFLGREAPPEYASAFLGGYFDGRVPADRIALFRAKNLCLRWHGALEALSAGVERGNVLLGLGPLRGAINAIFYRRVMLQLARAAGGGRIAGRIGKEEER